MVDVILVNPITRDCTRELNKYENLYLLEMKSYLDSQSYKTQIMDTEKEQLSPKEAVKEILKYEPLVVCVWVMYGSLEYCMSLFKELGYSYNRSSQYPVILAAGHAATLSGVDLLRNTSYQELNAILLGEAEESLAEVIGSIHRGGDWRQVPGLLYQDITGCIQQSPRRVLSSNLDKFPIPRRQTPSFSPNQWVEIRGSRGCYYHCSFCNVRAFYGTASGPTWRGHSVDRMIREIRYLYGKGARRFYFVDDQFFGPGKQGMERVRSFALALIDLGLDIEWQIFCRVDNVKQEIFQLMREAGLTVVNIGIEGGSQTQLNRMNKRQTVSQIMQAVEIIRQLGITLIPSFIMFDPYVTLDEIESNIRLIKQLDFITYLGPNSTIPFPGTPLTKRVRVDRLLDIEHPIIPGFIPDVRMVNPEAALLRTLWVSWQTWINESFDNLEIKLMRAAYAYQLSDSQTKEELKGLYFLARRLKFLEADYVCRCIRGIRDNFPKEDLFALRSQYADVVSSIALAVPLDASLVLSFNERKGGES